MWDNPTEYVEQRVPIFHGRDVVCRNSLPFFYFHLNSPCQSPLGWNPQVDYGRLRDELCTGNMDAVRHRPAICCPSIVSEHFQSQAMAIRHKVNLS